jgi:hypothetical protein
VEIAGQILQDIDDLGQDAQMWDYGTAMEAALALDDYGQALKWARQYVSHPGVDAFELASTLRQLREVWKLEESKTGKKLLPAIQYKLAQCEGGMLELTSISLADPAGFEAIYGNQGYIYLTWMDTMYERCRAVARVINTATGEPFGTGFLVKGSELWTEWGSKPVFVTNAHVISNNASDKAPLQPGEGSAEFTRLPERPKIELGQLLFSSVREELDVSVFEIEAPAELLPLEVTPYRPLIPGENDPPQRIYIIGHPKGGELTVSLYSNNLVAYDNQYIHYRSPTEGGHSGSPVFTRQWKLLAVHHKARDELKANEGVLFEPIKQAVSS